MVSSEFALARPVLADRLPRGLLRDIALIGGIAALTAVSARVAIPVPGSPVPVTGQTFAVLLGAAAAGPLRGALAQVLYIVVGVLGAPVYASGAHGYHVLVGATGGYFIGFLMATWLVGSAARSGYDRRPAGVVAAFLLGSALIYVPGVLWLAHYAHLSLDTALREGMVPYLPGDVLKALLAAVVLPVAWKGVHAVDTRE